MTPDDIRNTPCEHDDGAWESARWLREIAAQLAEQNFSLALIAQHLDRLAETQEEAHK
jgi:hypothetical protein